MNTTIARASRITGLVRLACLCGLLIWVLPIQAEIIDYIYQDGSNVVASYSGTIDLTDLIFSNHATDSSQIAPPLALQIFNPGNSSTLNVYNGISGPSSFGSGGRTGANSSTGDTFAFEGTGTGAIAPPDGYTSGSFISGSETFDSTTLSGLGLIDGTYTYTWGTGPDADSLVVEIGTAPATVPEPASLGLLSLLAVSLVIVSRRRASVA